MSSRSKLRKLALLDFAYAFAVSIVKREGDETELYHMAERLKKLSVEALVICDCRFITDSDKKKVLKIAADAANLGFEGTEVKGAAWTAFLVAAFENMLEIPLKANGKPKKNGWIRHEPTREKLAEIHDLLVQIYLIFDDDFSDDLSAEAGVRALKFFRL